MTPVAALRGDDLIDPQRGDADVPEGARRVRRFGCSSWLRRRPRLLVASARRLPLVACLRPARTLRAPEGRMNFVITRQPNSMPDSDGKTRTVTVEFDDVVDVQVCPIDQDNRTQAERNADNALAAARLVRMEKHVRELRDALHGIPGSAKVLVEPLLEKLDEALKAPIEP